MLVDFHVHSTASDGTFRPSELVGQASGYAALALTDHDNCDGADEFLASATSASDAPRLVTGVELSIEPGEGFDMFHLLGLGVNPRHPALVALLARILEGRRERNAHIVANFARLGFDMADTIDAYAHGEVLARPHFARWLVDRGHAPDVKTAFETYLTPDSPPATRCYVERLRPSQEDAFRVIHQAGGIAVMAHPKYWRREWKSTGPDFDAAARGFAALKERGLDGIEAFYRANTMEENIGFTRLARSNGFLLTAGSDFHGANKPDIRLGMKVDDAFIGPLLERLGLSSPRSHAIMV